MHAVAAPLLVLTALRANRSAAHAVKKQGIPAKNTSTLLNFRGIPAKNTSTLRNFRGIPAKNTSTLPNVRGILDSNTRVFIHNETNFVTSVWGFAMKGYFGNACL